MYKVIGKTNTRAMRVLWAMHEIGLEFDHIKAAAQSIEAQKANISGKVPSLISVSYTHLTLPTIYSV